MSKNQHTYLDLSNSKSLKEILPSQSSLSSQETGWHGLILRHFDRLPPHEFSEYHPQQHLIIVHQQQHLTDVERQINGKKQNLIVENKDIALIPARHSHGAAWQNELELTVLIIEPDFMSQVAYEWIDPDDIELLPLFTQRDPFIERVALLLKDSLATGESCFYAESMATALSAHLIQHYSIEKPLIRNYTLGLSQSKLQRVKNYIRDRLSENISLQDVCREVGLSKCYFAQLFKQSTGISPYQYIIEQRVRKARHLLKQDIPLVEIALSCGFANQSAFNKTFYKCMGITPRQYRLKI